MKSFSVFWAFTLATASAVAQTNVNAPAAPATDISAPAAQPPGTNAAMAPTAPAGNTAKTREMSLDDCIQEALQHNLDVQIERTVPQISLYNLHGAYSGYDPLLTLSGQHNYNKTGGYIQDNQFVLPTESDEDSFSAGLSGGTPWGMTYNMFGNQSETTGEKWGRKGFLTTSVPFDLSGGAVGVELEQPLLKNFWIDDTRRSIRLARNQLKSDEQGLRSQIIDSITAVENAYYELIYARENVRVQQEALNLAQTQLDQDRQRVQIGTLAQLDVQQDESQVATSRANLIAAEYALATAQNTLKNLLTDQYARWHDVDIQPTGSLTNAPLQLFDLQDSWGKGMAQRPDLMQYRLSVEAQGIWLKYYRNQLFPQLDAFGSYGYNGNGREYSDVFAQINETDQPFWSYGGKLSMPLSNRGPRNSYKASKVSLQQLLLKLKQFEQKVMVDIDNAVKSAQSAYQSVDATRQARIYAEAALDAEQKKYAVGKSTTFTVLQLQNSLTSARSQEIRALADYYKALATLAQQEGTTLERNRINIEAK